MKPTKILIQPLILLFLLFNTFFLFGKTLLGKWGLQFEFLIVANLIFFIISVIAFLMQKKALKNANPNVFIRSVMGGMLIKMAICIVAVAVYTIAFKENFSSNSIMAAMFLYLVYLGVEVAVATKLNRHKNG
jgi:hypothetical protein